MVPFPETRNMGNRDCAKRKRTAVWLLWGALGLVATAVAALPARLAAQMTTTTVQGTVYRADGTPATGTLLVSWSAFTTPQNQAVAAGNLSTAIGADGFVSVNLTPNAAALPTGSYYTAVYHLSDGTVNQEYWVVPATATASIAAVRAQLEPSTVAVQPVSQAYVDSAIASLSGSWLPLSGGTLTGPLTLNENPTAANQAATKSYADQLAAADLPLGGGTLTGPLNLAADPSAGLQAATKEYVDSGVSAAQATANVAQNTANAALPATAGTADEKQINGTLYADQMQSQAGGNNGIAMSLAECLTYNYACQVIAPAMYARTEAQPWGGAGIWVNTGNGGGGAVQGPSSTVLGGTSFTDLRYGGMTVLSTDYEGYPQANVAAGASFTQFSTAVPQGLYSYTAPGLMVQHYTFDGGRNSYLTDETNNTGLRVVNGENTMGGMYGVAVTTQHHSPGDNIGFFEWSMDRGGINSGDNEGQIDKYIHAEAGDVYQGTLNSITTSGIASTVCTAPCTVFGTTQTQGFSGSLGAFLPVIDLTRADSSGLIASLANGGQGASGVAATGADWDSAYGDTVAYGTTTTAILNTGSGVNSFPRTNVTVSISPTSGTPTTSLPFCLFGSPGGMNYECDTITAASASSVTLAVVYQPFASGADWAQGGMTGMGFEMDADRQANNQPYGGIEGQTGQTIRDVCPVYRNVSGNTLFPVPGGGGWNCGWARAYTQMGSGGSVSLTVSGGVVTACTASGGSGYGGATDGGANNPPQVSVSVNAGATPPVIYAYAYASSSLNNCVVESGGSGITSATATVVPTNSYAVYPMMQTVNVWNPATGKVDGSSIAGTVMSGTFQTGDKIEQEHWWAHSLGGDRYHIAQYQEGTPSVFGFDYEFGGYLGYAGLAGEMNNDNPLSLYMGYPGQAKPWVPGYGQLNTPQGILLNGAWRNGLVMTPPPFQGGQGSQANALVAAECNDQGTDICASWNAFYNVALAGNAQNNGYAEDGLQYNPTTYSWRWTAGATGTAATNPFCTVSLAGAANGGLSIACNGNTSSFDTSGDLSLPGSLRARNVTGASINGEVTVDGTTYTTLNAAWNAAVNQANTTGQDQAVRLGPGTYPVTATLTEPSNSTCVSLLGSGGTTVNADSTQVATTLTVPTSLGGDVFYEGNTAQAQGCTFKDFNLLAGGNATHGFELQWFRGLLIDNVTVNDTTAEGILLGEENTATGHQANFLLRNITVSYSSAAFTPANRPAWGIHLQKTAIDSHLDDIVVRNALTAGVYNEGTGNTGYLIHGFGYPYTCTTGPCVNNASSGSAANASYATSYVIYDTGGSGSVWTDTYVDSPAVAGFYVGANGIAIDGGHIQWPDVTSFPAANLAYVAANVTNNLLIADVDCLEMASGVNWITYAGAAGNPPSYASVHHLTGCGNYYQALEDAEVTGYSSGGANINDPSGAVPRVWSTPIASASSYPAYAAQMYTGYQGDAFQAHFSGVNPFFNVTYQGTIRSNGGIALSTIINTASTLTLTAANKNVIANAASGAQTITLPSCYTPLPDKASPAGLEFTIIKSDTSANAVTLQTVSSQNINYLGATAQTLVIGAAGKRTLVCGPDYNWYAY